MQPTSQVTSWPWSSPHRAPPPRALSVAARTGRARTATSPDGHYTAHLHRWLDDSGGGGYGATEGIAWEGACDVIVVAAPAPACDPSPRPGAPDAPDAPEPHCFRLSGHRGPVVAAAFTSDGCRLATAGADAVVMLWDLPPPPPPPARPGMKHPLPASLPSTCCHSDVSFLLI